MIYFTNPTGDAIQHMVNGYLGFIDTPLQGNRRPREIAIWCADNGCFNDERFNESKWWAWLESHADDAGTCAFATAPDVLANHAATVRRSQPWLPRIRKLGFKAAFVAQDGSSVDSIPWNDFDVLFIGGSTEWKLGPIPRELTAHAKSLGMWVHFGRVNSAKRLRYADSIGCDSADGTKIVYGPSENLPKILGWVDDVHSQPSLFRLAGGA